MTMRGTFAGLKDAQVGGSKRPYMRAGRYVVRVTKGVFKAKVRKGGSAAILEFDIVQSNYDEMLAQAVRALTGQQFKIEELDKTLPNKAGTNSSWYQSLADEAIGWGALKGFAASILGQSPDGAAFKAQVEGFIESIYERNALVGTLLPLECIAIKTAANNDFTRFEWGQAIEQGQG